MALSYFTLNSWNFKNDKILWLQEQVPEDDKAFSLLETKDFDVDLFIAHSLYGVYQYLLKVPTYDVKAIRQLHW